MKLVIAKKGFVLHLLPVVIVVIAIWAFVIYLIMQKGAIKNTSFVPKKEPTVSLKTEYKNPFKKETQYVNPFASYKNPFVTNR